MKENYIITASCDPYHAKFHHSGEQVLRRDGATPVEWVEDDNFGEGYTEEEARERLWKMACVDCVCKDYLTREDDDSVADLKETMMHDLDMTEEEAKNALLWYQGEGIYHDDSHEPIIRKGGRSYTIDTMTYAVENIGDYEE